MFLCPVIHFIPLIGPFSLLLPVFFFLLCFVHLDKELHLSVFMAWLDIGKDLLDQKLLEPGIHQTVSGLDGSFSESFASFLFQEIIISYSLSVCLPYDKFAVAASSH